MTSETYAEAERLSRRRARMMPILAVMFLMQQSIFFAGGSPERHGRTVDLVRTGGVMALTLVLLVGVCGGGFWLKPRAVRVLLNDEVSRANRADALSLGFVFAMLVAIALYAVNLFEPIEGSIVLHIVTTFGIGAALLRFGMLERRAHRA